MLYKCKYCDKEFESKQKLGGHTTYCDKNPNKDNNMLSLNIVRSHIDYYRNTHLTCYCQYCNKEIGNKGCLTLHEKRCIYNPNYELTEKQKEKLNNKGKKKVLTQEHKDKIRESLNKWRQNNKDKFLQYSRKKSVCQENFKEYLKSKNIDFIEEYCPYPEERLYSLDIAFPDKKIAIEINGSQHYNIDGTLNDYTKEKEQFFVNHGWKIYQIYYKQCYGIIKDELFNDILSLPIYDTKYIKEDFDRKKQKQLKKQLEKYNKQIQKDVKYQTFVNNKKKIFLDLEQNSNIDFSKFGWVSLAEKYLKDIHNYNYKNLHKCISKYYPEFYINNNVFVRK